MHRTPWVGLLLATLFLLLLAASPASASRWYAGNHRSAGYGVKSDIRTPPSQPAVYSGFIASWVSLPSPDFVQTGWDMPVYTNTPKSYVEHSIAGNYGITHYSTQAYNYARAYEVVWLEGGTNMWRALIQGADRGSWGPITAPQPVIAYSEVDWDSRNQLCAGFNNTQYKGQYTYYNFDQSNWVADYPYSLIMYYPYKYSTHGNGM